MSVPLVEKLWVRCDAEAADQILFLITALAATFALFVALHRAAPGRLAWGVLPAAACSFLTATALWVAATDRFLKEIREAEEPNRSIASQAASAAPWCAVSVGAGWAFSSLAKWDRGVRHGLAGERDENDC